MSTGAASKRVRRTSGGIHHGWFRKAIVARASQGHPERTEIAADGRWSMAIRGDRAMLTGRIRLTEPRPDDAEHPLHVFELELPSGAWPRANSESFSNGADVDGTHVELLATLDVERGRLTLYADLFGSAEGWDWLEVR